MFGIPLNLDLFINYHQVLAQTAKKNKFHQALFALFRLVEGWDWKNLPPSYLEGPYQSIDKSALDSRFHSNHESVEDHNVDSLDYDSQPDSTMVTEQDCSESASSVLHCLPERRVCIVSKRNINL